MYFFYSRLHRLFYFVPHVDKLNLYSQHTGGQSTESQWVQIQAIVWALKFKGKVHPRTDHEGPDEE